MKTSAGGKQIPGNTTAVGREGLGGGGGVNNRKTGLDFFHFFVFGIYCLERALSFLSQ